MEIVRLLLITFPYFFKDLDTISQASSGALANLAASNRAASKSNELLQDQDELRRFMMDEDYAPLSAHCVRALCDKMYEKRKAAALEIEKLTKDCIHVNNQTQVQKLLRVLGTDFAMSQNPNMRKGKYLKIKVHILCMVTPGEPGGD